MSPEKFSKLLKDRSFVIDLTGDVNDWSHLIGNLFTCPLCGKKAVIIMIGTKVPVRRVKDVPCHCAIGIEYAEIYYYWCRKKCYRKRAIKPKGRLLYWEDNKLDVCKPFNWYIENGYKFRDGG